MKASELIKKLEQIIKAHGDIEVKIPDTDDCYYGCTDIQYIEVETTYNCKGEKEDAYIELNR